MVPTLAVALDVVYLHRNGERFMDSVLVLMSLLLMVLAASLAFEQYVSIHRIRLLRHIATPGANRVMDTIARRFVIADADRLELRLKFILERFNSPHAMRFHFVQVRHFLFLPTRTPHPPSPSHDA